MQQARWKTLEAQVRDTNVPDEEQGAVDYVLLASPYSTFD